MHFYRILSAVYDHFHLAKYVLPTQDKVGLQQYLTEPFLALMIIYGQCTIQHGYSLLIEIWNRGTQCKKKEKNPRKNVFCTEGTILIKKSVIESQVWAGKAQFEPPAYC